MAVETTAEKLVFPALIINRDGEMLVVKDTNELQTTNVLALRRQFYDDMLVVDSAGSVYRVAGISAKRPVPPLWGSDSSSREKFE